MEGSVEASAENGAKLKFFGFRAQRFEAKASGSEVMIQPTFRSQGLSRASA